MVETATMGSRAVSKDKNVDNYTVVPDDKRALVAICYVFTWLGGIVLLFMSENNRALKFHAFQNIVLGVLIFILSAVSPLTICITGLLSFVLWLYCLWGAWQIYTTGDWHSFATKFVEDSLMK